MKATIYAKTDLSDASKWYEKQQKGLGNTEILVN